MRKHFSGDFDLRAERYECLDRALAPQTRFFAAAGLTNRLFGTLCNVLPAVISCTTASFLCALGRRLEAPNYRLAQDLQEQRIPDCADQFLVCAEQMVVERYCWSFRREEEILWRQVRGELNDLLNGSHIASLLAPVLGHSRKYQRVLTAVRARMGVALDFNNERHRVAIGCALIQELRSQPG
jgi:hypothetical protein